MTLRCRRSLLAPALHSCDVAGGHQKFGPSPVFVSGTVVVIAVDCLSGLQRSDTTVMFLLYGCELR
jgi:hypothetical protein